MRNQAFPSAALWIGSDRTFRFITIVYNYFELFRCLSYFKAPQQNFEAKSEFETALNKYLRELPSYHN